MGYCDQQPIPILGKSIQYNDLPAFKASESSINKTGTARNAECPLLAELDQWFLAYHFYIEQKYANSHVH